MESIKKDPKLAEAARMRSELKRQQLNKINFFWNENFQFIIIIAVLAALFCGYYFLLLPKYQKVVVVVKADIATKRQVFLERRRELNNLERVVDLYKLYKNTNENNVNRLADMIPVEYTKEELFTEIVYLISKNNFSLLSINIANAESLSAAPAPTKVATPAAGGSKRQAVTPGSARPVSSPSLLSLPASVGSYNIKVSIGKVNYSSLRKLLNSMENSLRLLDINNVKFDPATGTADLEINTYYLKSF